MFSTPALASIDQQVRGINLCIQAKLPLAALTLIYVGIDAFGALGRPPRQPRKSGADFVAWADKYVVQPKQLPITGLDLYGARCGLLHNLAAESDLSVKGKARPILYAWGDRDTTLPNALLQKLSNHAPDLRAVVVKVEELASAFVSGIALFGKDVDSNPEFEAEVSMRSRKIFGQYEQFPGMPQLPV